MAVAKMRKVTIFASRELENDLFERLRDLGIMQVTDSSVVEKEPSESSITSFNDVYQDRLSKLGFIRSYFERYNVIKKGFIDMFTGKKPEMSREEFEETVRRFDIDGVFERVRGHDERLKEIAKESLALSARSEALSPWKDLDIPLEAIGKTWATENILAVFPAADWPKLQEEFLAKGIHSEVIWRSRSDLGVWLLAFSEGDGSLASLVSSSGGTLVNLSKTGGGDPERGLVKDILEGIERRSRELSLERDAIQKEDADMAENLVQVLALTDYYLDKLNLSQTRQHAATTDFTLIVEGYVRERDVDKLVKGLSEFKEIEIVSEEPENPDEVPVYLENGPIIRPFEVITNIFGYPKYNEIDPTPILAPFFWIFFGICLADAVYGIALTVGSWYFLRTHKLSDGGQKFVRLLMYSGVSAAIAGALMGSWMGDLVSVFFPGTAVERFVLSMTLLNPIEDPLTLLVISLGFGIFQVWVGIIVKMYSLIRSGQVYEGIISQGSWVLFLPGLIGTALARAGYINSNFPFYVMLVGAFMVMYSASRGQRNILLKPFAGVYGLYSTIGYFSDTMSYARLLALGLASAIIGVVINKISQLAVTMIPTVGWVFVPIILIVGHVFNLVINVLGSFIHSGRLQFVEFFTKFFEGGGKPFKPLTRVSEYTSVS
ncbi:MAG: V-type ATP synthase subunit I [Candidatus Fermentithermobacillus carboniphilus]|uniref:V-type ATP synthase subunit I n=1 Tax=Candidatus Fermentithermobacillus carboniphilus TaxID=3085328 RepID=A0AAT9LA16_9FIRM|nr:MAG: V-type ATP synthase subunit I [Candidatus Fermentithermobacillus carboniphilus]